MYVQVQYNKVGDAFFWREGEWTIKVAAFKKNRSQKNRMVTLWIAAWKKRSSSPDWSWSLNDRLHTTEYIPPSYQSAAHAVCYTAAPAWPNERGDWGWTVARLPEPKVAHPPHARARTHKARALAVGRRATTRPTDAEAPPSTRSMRKGGARWRPSTTKLYAKPPPNAAERGKNDGRHFCAGWHLQFGHARGG